MEKFIQRYENLDLQGFIVANRNYWPIFESFLQGVPFQTRFIDPSKQSGQEFIHKMISLNEKAYGKGMAAPAWTFANFGSIAAGITAGFMSKGHPISKLTLVGTLADPDISHEWTLLVDPEYESKGLGSITYALALQLAQNKKYHTFILQTDNGSANIYLKSPYPLEIQAYGFVHTATNSMLLKTKIPAQNPFEAMLKQKSTIYQYNEFPLAVNAAFTNSNKAWFAADNHSLFLEMNDEIQRGAKYNFIGKTIKDEKIFLLIEKINL